MNGFCGKVIATVLLVIAVTFCPLLSAWCGESIGQKRMAFLELSRVRSISTSGISYKDYRDALIPARESVSLLRDSDATVTLLRQTMSYYEQALMIWGLQEDSEFPVDSLRTDEPNGAAILNQCPDIARFHYKQRDQIYVKDAVNCIWHLTAELLETAPIEIR